MIKNAELLQRFEEEELRKEPTDYAYALKVFEGLWREGMEIGVLPHKDALEGIEVDVRIARILNRGGAKGKAPSNL